MVIVMKSVYVGENSRQPMVVWISTWERTEQTAV